MAETEGKPGLLIDPRWVLENVRFVIRALQHNRLLIGVVWACFLAFSVAAAVLLPREYWTEVKLLARKNSIMPALVHPQRTVPSGSDDPTQSASELVHDRAVLLRIVREQHMVDRWSEARGPVLRLKDAVHARLLGPLTKSQVEDALVEMLDRQLHLTVHDEIVSIGTSWSDRQMAVDIVLRAQAAFIEARRHSDVDAYADSYQILMASADTARAEVDRRLQALEAAQAEAKRQRAQTTLGQNTQIANLDQLRGRVLEQIRQREDLEQSHAKTLSDLQAQLTRQEATLGPRNPDILATKDALAKATVNEGDLVQARADEERLTRVYVLQGGSREDLEKTTTSTGPHITLSSLDEDYAVVNARTLLAIESEHYQTLMQRLADTKLEMETAVAAFPGRFTVISPPKWPKKPYKPNVPFVLAGGMMAGLLAGSLAAVLLEIRRRANASLVLSARIVTPDLERSEVG